jgi:hypothetical protein
MSWLRGTMAASEYRVSRGWGGMVEVDAYGKATGVTINPLPLWGARRLGCHMTSSAVRVATPCA